MKLEFDFNTGVLSKVLSAVGKAPVEPNLNIQFSVKDKDAVSEELLVRAAENAKKKAEILTKASNATPVSYTHLDVYKRQQFSWLSKMPLRHCLLQIRPMFWSKG